MLKAAYARGMRDAYIKLGFNVGLGASTSSSGTGAYRGEPADEGRRPRSVIERGFQKNEILDNFPAVKPSVVSTGEVST